MPLSCYQEPSIGLASKPNSMPMQKDWGKAGCWSPRPSLNEALNLKDPDCWFESDQSSVSTSSSVSSRFDRSGGSRHTNSGQWCCRESSDYLKINLPVFKDEDVKTPSLIKAGIGTWWCITTHGAETIPFSPMLSTPCKVIQVSWLEVWKQTSPWMAYSPYWMRITTMSRP